MANHYRKTLKLYKRNQKSPGCPFCKTATVEAAQCETSELYVVPNITPYDLWELHDVVDHLLVVPKRHVTKLNELSDKEQLAIMKVIADYEAKGYSAYARGNGFVKRSTKHQHTHLIKASNKLARFALYIRRPYFLKKY